MRPRRVQVKQLHFISGYVFEAFCSTFFHSHSGATGVFRNAFMEIVE